MWILPIGVAMVSPMFVFTSPGSSVPFLVKDNENGLIYESGNLDMLYEKVKYLLDHPEEQQRLGRAAYSTITEEWDAETAAERFVALAQRILDGEKYPEMYVNGPCSRPQ